MPGILYAASSYGHINSFHIPYINALIKQGFSVDVLASGDYSKLPEEWNFTPASFKKNFFSIGNFITAFKIAGLIKKNGYDAVYTHTSLAAFFVRLGVMLSFKKPLVINMVHGYLFDDKTKPLKRAVLLCAEKFMKPVTDTVIVMNEEDLEIARKHKLFKDRLHFVHGVGVDTKRFLPVTAEEKSRLRREYNIGEEDFVMVYAAEFSKRKNQSFLVSALKELKGDIPVKLILLGKGDLLSDVKELSERLGLKDDVIFPGHVKRVEDYAGLSDVLVSSSRSEGLPLNVMEGMACGLPAVLSAVKGHADLVENGENGYLYPFDDKEEFMEKIRDLYSHKDKRREMGRKSREIIAPYSSERVFPEIMEILNSEWERKGFSMDKKERQ